MLVAAAKAGFDIEELEDERPRRFEHPFDSSRKRMTVVCDVGGELVAYVKGAPKETIELCTHVRDCRRRPADHRRRPRRRARRQRPPRARRRCASSRSPSARSSAGEDAADMATRWSRA